MNALVLVALLAADAGAPDAGAPDGGSPPSTPAVCVGRNLDLDRIFASNDCNVSRETQPPPDPAALGIELSPKKLRLRAGKSASVTISFRNRTAAPLPVELPITCGLDVVFETEIYRGDTRADLPDGCGVGRGCGQQIVRVILAPHGVARVHVSVSATAQVLEDCNPAGRKPLEAGTYKLLVNTPLVDRVADTNQVNGRQAAGQLTVTAR